ncbi:hypothetical protein LINPERPRIM_LOCUS722 [Linum perenne]
MNPKWVTITCVSEQVSHSIGLPIAMEDEYLPVSRSQFLDLKEDRTVPGITIQRLLNGEDCCSRNQAQGSLFWLQVPKPL